MENNSLNKTKAKHNLTRLLGDFISAHPFLTISSFAAILVSSIAAIIGSYAIQRIVAGLNGIVDPSQNEAFVADVLFPNIVLMVSIYSVSILLILYYSVALAVAGQDFMDRLRKRVFAHMEDLPISYFDQHQKGDIMSVYTNDIDTVRQFVITTMQSLLACITAALFILVFMTLISVPLTAIVIASVGAMFATAMVLGTKSGHFFVAQQAAVGKQEGLIEEAMEGLKVVKSFSHEKELEEEFDRSNEVLLTAATKANVYVNSINPIMNVLGYLGFVLVAAIGTAMFVLHWANLSLLPFAFGPFEDMGTIVAFVPLISQLTGTVSEMSQQFGFIGPANAGTGRVYEMLGQPLNDDEGYVTLVRGTLAADGTFAKAAPGTKAVWFWRHPHLRGNTVSYVRVAGDIAMNDVDFSYVPGKIAIKGVSLYAKPGQKVAFVGATGAGKTTITNLLNRFYDIADGKIRYDGININKIRKHDLRRSLGMVLQDTSLFTGTIRENIRFGRLDATDREVAQAAALANANLFIEKLPQGYETVITGDGNPLSQGQCQLLSIARAVLADPPVLILDEATSSVDTRTEALVTKGMDALMVGRTVFVIAHRLSTVKNADVIMVLEHGMIIERGTHDQLMAKKGTYYRLYTGNFTTE